ncbi:PDR/VanB family oxidoreductase [Williamsia sp. DF01-3]|uniref:PDR/VanB family oxidoreductase n=1 Tax=Williamsia sp. DF01-3 TaxID=2934157 RepID=UPI001FF597C9|nr:PDR/VanB family oxidoreductase [Williamsia sp. DF01-3]MCK0520312.1 PDR/VanB family oxidoreductase [Williamsia sp. DF01-3]
MNQRHHPHTTSMTAPPPHLYNRYQHDPAMRIATLLGKVWFPLWSTLTKTPVPKEVHRVTTVRIIGREVVAEDENVVALTLADPDGGELTPWYAGAHLDLLLPSGRMREYSLCGDPADRDHYRIAVRRIPDGGGGSVEVHDQLRVGDLLRIKGPRNAFPLALPGHGSPARRLRFIAGGIGITPILPMLQAAERLGLDWSMVYTGRSVDSLPFVEELARYGDRITVRTDDTDGIPTAHDLLGGDDADSPGLPGTSVYCCGPVPMLNSIRAALAGRADIELHFERFSPPPVLDGRPFRVTLDSTDGDVAVGATESTLAAVRRVLPSVPYSCQQGFCGTCKVRVLEGKVEHRDNILTEPERDAGVMLTCVSRAEGDHLRLDL